MTISFHKHFSKALSKLSTKDQIKVEQRLVLFKHYPLHSQLRNHPLQGSFVGFRSIDIKPDLRAIYKEIDKEVVQFYYLGSHSQLYR